MIEEIPDWLAVPLIAILWATVAYKLWIRPGYENDKKDKNNG